MGLVSKRRGHWAGLLRLQRSSTSLNSDGVIGLYDFDGGGADICITGVPASSNSDRQSEYGSDLQQKWRFLARFHRNQHPYRRFSLLSHLH
ncbi:hypothetical protein FXO38_23866 [Capsicum annuum]|nr:hypothetical protein FXO38_23866 [Capsicum annuum]